MLNQLVFGVEVVQYNISIARMGGCEYKDLKVLAQLFKALSCVRPNVNPCLDDVSAWEFDRQYDIRRYRRVFIAMDQRLIEIKNDRFFI